MKKKIERTNQILDIIKSHTNISVKELASLLDVSEMTIRRDVETLKADRQVNTLYGAVMYVGNDREVTRGDNYYLSNAKSTHNEEKFRIGTFASSLISSEDVLIIDTGSTTEAFARCLSPAQKATILCYNSNILNVLLEKPNIDLIFSGGYYHPNSQMFESKAGLSLIQSTRANKAFISAAGVHQTLGVTCANSYEIETKKAIYNSSVEKILLADSSKFSVVKSAYFANPEDFDVIITDTNLSQEWVDYIHELNITLHLV